MAALTDLPIEIIQDNLAPFLEVKDLVHLTCTNRHFATVCSDEAIWKRKLVADFNFTGAGTARTSGWKVIYRGLHRPKVYVWGDTANGRLGTTDLPKTSVHGVPFPFQLKLPNVRVVSLVAGGMSFHALDSDGFLHVWGTLDGNSPVLTSNGFSEAGKRALTPLKLLMPSPIRSVSCGRLHTSALDARGKVWTFTSWGRPFSFDTPALNNPIAPVIAVEAGWTFSAALLSTGDVYVWWPFNDPLSELVNSKNRELDEDPNNKALANEKQEIRCVPFGLDFQGLTKLPHLPALPALQNAGTEIESADVQLVQIAGLDNSIVGVTNHGHVLKFDNLAGNQDLSQTRWQYLPHFSEIERVKEHQVFNENGGKAPVSAPDVMRITHITGNFKNFVAYSTGSSSLVLMGSNEATEEAVPEIKPELQNRDVISVAVGDWHSVALTADGHVYSWGEFSSGALGLGDPAKLEPGTPGAYAMQNAGRRARPPRVESPTLVRFDHGAKGPTDRFAFAITAGGWHTGALVIDLDPRGVEDDVYEMEPPDVPVYQPETVAPGHPMIGQSPPIIPAEDPLFRLGLAGAHRHMNISPQRGRGGRIRGGPWIPTTRHMDDST